MHQIILKNWYQETADEYQEEPYHNKEFESLEEACIFLGDNYEEILNEFPVQEIYIKINNHG